MGEDVSKEGVSLEEKEFQIRITTTSKYAVKSWVYCVIKVGRINEAGTAMAGMEKLARDEQKHSILYIGMHASHSVQSKTKITPGRSCIQNCR